MALAGIQKKEILTNWFGSSSDTGSSQAQIALLSERIKILSKHITDNKKDFSSKRGLMVLVGQRRKLLAYLGRTNPALCEEIKVKIKS